MTEATSQWNKAYHWKTKGCTPWAKQYFHDRLVGRTGTPGGGEVTIDALKDWDGGELRVLCLLARARADQ